MAGIPEGMKLAARCLAAGLVLVLHIPAAIASKPGTPVAAGASPPPRAVATSQIALPDGASSAQIAPDHHARPTLEVRIAGQGPFRFLVDTGAQATVIGRDLARQLALPPAGRAMLVATGSRQPVDLVEVTALSFATREMNLPAIPVLESQYLGADGILGLDTLQGLRVLIDFRDRRITIADPDEEQLIGRYEIIVRARQRLGQMVIMDAEVDGIRTAIVVDTGAGLSIGNPALQRRLRAKLQENAKGTDVNGVTFQTDMRFAKRIAIGSMVIDNSRIGFTDSPAFHALGLADRPALILGMSALGGLDRLAIDFATRRVMFDLPRTKSSWARSQTF